MVEKREPRRDGDPQQDRRFGPAWIPFVWAIGAGIGIAVLIAVAGHWMPHQ
jgi:hypothetical protein